MYNPFENPRRREAPILRGRDVSARIIAAQSRLMVFDEVQRGVQEGVDPDFREIAEFYIRESKYSFYKKIRF